MNKKTKIVLCYIIAPILGVLYNALRDEVKETKTPWDDVALEGLKALGEGLRKICNSMQA